jgi:hypothetical protein
MCRIGLNCSMFVLARYGGATHRVPKAAPYLIELLSVRWIDEENWGLNRSVW